jgi:Inhibitor of Apoptosis domain
MNDHASCFHCNGGLHNWDPNDDPWAEHARWFSRCPYVNIIKGQEYIQEIIKDKPPIIPVEDLNLNGGAGAPPAPDRSNEETNQVANGVDDCAVEQEEDEEAAAVEVQPENLETEEIPTEEDKKEDG